MILSRSQQKVVTLMTLWLVITTREKRVFKGEGQDHADLNDIVVGFYNQGKER
jgi:hypothetical protein